MIALGALFPNSGLNGVDGGRMVRGLASDSRKIADGYVFFAVSGTKADGLGFVADASARGAIAVVTQNAEGFTRSGMAVVAVGDVRTALFEAAARFYPSQPATIVAVTGTSGKTSIADFVRQIWIHLNLSAASMGTLGIVSPKGSRYGTLTTPDPIALHHDLSLLAGEGVTHLALEASSHGLDQRRLDGVRLAAGAFSNLSRDHLDYHASVANYLAAKMRLFSELLKPNQPAVIDADGPSAPDVIATARARGLRVFTVGYKGEDLRLVAAVPDGFSTRLTLSHNGQVSHINLPLAGSFQVSNALVAAGLCITTGVAGTKALPSLEHLKGAPGRLEYVGTAQGGQVFIDYAHKPDALAKALQALRPFAQHALMVVFGCGGDRDAGKRPLMGEIAVQNADVVFVTDDNPRSENAATIRQQILATASGAFEMADREQAIRAAVAMLVEGDVLLIAGKGHETGQIVGETVLPFSDHEVVLRILREAPK